MRNKNPKNRPSPTGRNPKGAGLHFKNRDPPEAPPLPIPPAPPVPKKSPGYLEIAEIVRSLHKNSIPDPPPQPSGARYIDTTVPRLTGHDYALEKILMPYKCDISTHDERFYRLAGLLETNDYMNTGFWKESIERCLQECKQMGVLNGDGAQDDILDVGMKRWIERLFGGNLEDLIARTCPWVRMDGFPAPYQGPRPSPPHSGPTSFSNAPSPSPRPMPMTVPISVGNRNMYIPPRGALVPARTEKPRYLPQNIAPVKVQPSGHNIPPHLRLQSDQTPALETSKNIITAGPSRPKKTTAEKIIALNIESLQPTLPEVTKRAQDMAYFAAYGFDTPQNTGGVNRRTNDASYLEQIKGSIEIPDLTKISSRRRCVSGKGPTTPPTVQNFDQVEILDMTKRLQKGQPAATNQGTEIQHPTAKILKKAASTANILPQKPVAGPSDVEFQKKRSASHAKTYPPSKRLVSGEHSPEDIAKENKPEENMSPETKLARGSVSKKNAQKRNLRKEKVAPTPPQIKKSELSATAKPFQPFVPPVLAHTSAINFSGPSGNPANGLDRFRLLFDRFFSSQEFIDYVDLTEDQVLIKQNIFRLQYIKIKKYFEADWLGFNAQQRRMIVTKALSTLAVTSDSLELCYNSPQNIIPFLRDIGMRTGHGVAPILGFGQPWPEDGPKDIWSVYNPKFQRAKFRWRAEYCFAINPEALINSPTWLLQIIGWIFEQKSNPSKQKTDSGTAEEPVHCGIAGITSFLDISNKFTDSLFGGRSPEWIKANPGRARFMECMQLDIAWVCTAVAREIIEVVGNVRRERVYFQIPSLRPFDSILGLKKRSSRLPARGKHLYRNQRLGRDREGQDEAYQKRRQLHEEQSKILKAKAPQVIRFLIYLQEIIDSVGIPVELTQVDTGRSLARIPPFGIWCEKFSGNEISYLKTEVFPRCLSEISLGQEDFLAGF